jgi:hypothetical protein
LAQKRKGLLPADQHDDFLFHPARLKRAEHMIYTVIVRKDKRIVKNLSGLPAIADHRVCDLLLCARRQALTAQRSDGFSTAFIQRSRGVF